MKRIIIIILQLFVFTICGAQDIKSNMHGIERLRGKTVFITILTDNNEYQGIKNLPVNEFELNIILEICRDSIEFESNDITSDLAVGDYNGYYVGTNDEPKILFISHDGYIFNDHFYINEKIIYLVRGIIFNEILFFDFDS